MSVTGLRSMAMKRMGAPRASASLSARFSYLCSASRTCKIRVSARSSFALRKQWALVVDRTLLKDLHLKQHPNKVAGLAQNQLPQARERTGLTFAKYSAASMRSISMPSTSVASGYCFTFLLTKPIV